MAVDDEFFLSPDDEADLLSLDVDIASPQINGNGKRTATDSLHQSENRKPFNAIAATLPHIDIATRVLKEQFGLGAFRLKQAEAISRLLDGLSAVVVFPTGGGKSLCYQVPALCFKQLTRKDDQRAASGITLVVSPLIALMKDQVDALKRRGISAAAIDSSQPRDDYFATIDCLRNGTLDILYCAPERLNNEGFVSTIANVNGGVRLLAIDEAHCISEWGHAFRPDYLKIARFASEIQAERVVCLTATATPDVARDVCHSFNIDTTGLFRTTTYRPNLRLEAKSFQTKSDSFPHLTAFLRLHPGPSIVYVTAQKDAEEVAAQLNQSGLLAKSFHAGMKPHDKTCIQDEFMSSDGLIIVATIAFGMGIDKANIRNVVHYALPRSLEGYSQEIGRAGRDGIESSCMLFLCAEDLHCHDAFARGDLPSKRSAKLFLKQVFSLKPDAQNLIEASHFQLSQECDIRPTTLGNMFAQLELRFHLMRATTPKYADYSFVELRSHSQDRSDAANAIRLTMVKKKRFTHVDVDKAARHKSIGRSAIISKMNAWNDDGIIELKTSGLLHMYRLHDTSWPPTRGRQDEIVDQMYQQLEAREVKDRQRTADVRRLITGRSCFARTLASHFGDTLPTASGDCGHCTWCETKTVVPSVKPTCRAWDADAWVNILQVVPARDDARYLARVAYGITSPRATAAKVTRDAVFGSMCDHDFERLLGAAQKICSG